MVTISTEDYVRIVERQKNAQWAKKGLSVTNIADAALSKKRKKYGNVKKDGIDSIAEWRRGRELSILQRCGKISFLCSQVRFLLVDGFTDSEWKKVRPIHYVADYTYKIGDVTYVEDVKSPATRKIETYRIKVKLLKLRYPEIRFVETVIWKK